MKIKSLFFACPFILLFMVTCCATRPEKAENGVDIAGDVNNHNDETLTVKSITANGYFADKTDETPFDPADFALYLTGGMEIVKVFHDPDINQWIKMPGREISGRYYFEYQSPLYSRPINSSDEMFAMLQHQAYIARKLNQGYAVNLDMDIRNGESGKIEHKTITLNVRPGITISGYRREGELRYTLKESDGSLKYGQYLVISVIITQDKEDADLYRAFQAWMEQTEAAGFSGLFGEMIKKSE
jgi:hypothetical protein